MAELLQRGSAATAWYDGSRVDFVAQTTGTIAGILASAANKGGWAIEPDQQAEWESSVSLLQTKLRAKGDGIRALAQSLQSPGTEAVTDVLLEVDLRRRGLRIDAVLLAPGVIFVIEFKRSAIDSSAREQLLGYATSLLEFHELTRDAASNAGHIVVPILVRTRGSHRFCQGNDGWAEPPFAALRRRPMECDSVSLGEAIAFALSEWQRQPTTNLGRHEWLASSFAPSSSLVDAAISLYGSHDVSAIRGHAASVAEIEACTSEVSAAIADAQSRGKRRVIVVTGTPGAGKTLVALNLAFSAEWRAQAVFVTGNAPLVDVLDVALKNAYRGNQRKTTGLVVASGYARAHVGDVVDKSTYRLVKAHRFLGDHRYTTGSVDGAVVLFDEAQRTYAKGRVVLRETLKDHEADLILRQLEQSYPKNSVVVAFLGRNQAINSGERGAIAWFEAAETCGWEFAIADESIAALPELGTETERQRWATHGSRVPMACGHLSKSMRFYRNAHLEKWVDVMLSGDVIAASAIARALDDENHTVWLTRDITVARDWVRRHRCGEDRAGIVGSSQARRLAAHGLHVDLKPDIAAWMLAPADDFRSSSALETVQNEYQIQGLELDWVVVGWGADLRRVGGVWKAHRLRGGCWSSDKDLTVSQNRYRVLLTRARKGMVLFVPEGVAREVDSTREPAFLDGTFEHLLACGARLVT